MGKVITVEDISKFLVDHKYLWFNEPEEGFFQSDAFKRLRELALNAGMTYPRFVIEEAALTIGVPFDVYQNYEDIRWFSLGYRAAHNAVVTTMIRPVTRPFFICTHADKRGWVTPHGFNLQVCLSCGIAEDTIRKCKKKPLFRKSGRCLYRVKDDPDCARCLRCGHPHEKDNPWL